MPVNRNLTLQIRRALYSLKREYGARVDVYKLDTAATNVKTGVTTIDKQVFPIKYAIVLPMRLNREVVQSISLISSNKEFVSGGGFEAGTRDVIIDRRDCPSLPDLTQNDWLVYDDEKYQIKTVEAFEV